MADAFAECSGVQLVPPGGAFYVFPRIDYQGMSGREFCEYMLEDHQVAMVLGEIFGDNYVRHMRISYERDMETQRAAAAKIVEVLYG